MELIKTTTYSNNPPNLYFTSHKGRLDLFQILLLSITIKLAFTMWQALYQGIWHTKTHTLTLYKILNFHYTVIWAVFLTDKVKLVANRLNSKNQRQLHHLIINKIIIIMFWLNSILIEHLLFVSHCFVEKTKHTRLLIDFKVITT